MCQCRTSDGLWYGEVASPIDRWKDNHMNKNEKSAATAEELAILSKDNSVQRIVVHGDLINVPSVRLAPGQFLRGEHEHSSLTFSAGADGLQLSSDNRIHNIRLNASADKRAIFNDTSVASLGRIELRGVTTTGRVQILARDKVRGGHVDVNGLDIIAADARGETERPHGYGVYVFTVRSRSGTCSPTTA